ncbi:sigma-54 interaction domain-containing protein [Mucilaginibacter terrae]|uniref:Transcriptional regulator with GAF, ATPase, and Fis domain n=1 Tax=Mucilaginibacter terrae TaxID=1955052 RepID=A0ABU3GQT8_9SPHI|nr:sigma-54 dependent transcriptional regulator [Mucilaginibacter terrae]MDT3402149.1 transcriptional regulator with GAF, ATPase, and Fis domain [Mucilaginibacter terrae]
MGGISEKLSNKSHRQLPAAVLTSNLQVAHLIDTFFKRLQLLYSIEYAVLLVYDERQTMANECFTSTYDLNEEVFVNEINAQPATLTNQQKVIAGYSFPVLKTAQEWVEETGKNHKPLNSHLSYPYHCYIPLETNNHVLGTFELHNSTEFSTECLAFCCSVADLIADIIQHQQNNYNSKVDQLHHVQAPPAVSNIERIESLEDLFDIVIKLLPATSNAVRKQFDELKKRAEQLDNATLYQPEEPTFESSYPNIIGTATAMKRVFGLIDQIANSDSTVLILGETGTGKELIAKAVHEHSGRKNHAIISLNCAAIPANLIESELFGHEKGAFTGATDKRLGKFELAQNGTLFLDEVGEIPLDLQVKLLRALQEKEIERVGGTSTIKCDVRVIAATNRNLQHEVEQGRFRRDLYFRLNVIPVELPALRERTEDIPLLAEYFINKYANKTNKQVTGLTKGAIRQLRNYTWPGNVREMEHLIERHVLLSKKPIISAIDLPVAETVMPGSNGHLKKIKTINENERDHIFEVLQLCNGRVSGQHGAAKLLGVPATTLNSKIKKLGLNRKHF